MNNLGPAPVQTPYDGVNFLSAVWTKWLIAVGQAVDNLINIRGAEQNPFSITGLPVYANNAAAIAGGLKPGRLYRSGADPDPVLVVH